MAKKQAETVYKIVEVVGVSEKSWEEAGRRAVETAANNNKNIRNKVSGRMIFSCRLEAVYSVYSPPQSKR